MMYKFASGHVVKCSTIRHKMLMIWRANTLSELEYKPPGNVDAHTEAFHLMKKEREHTCPCITPKLIWVLQIHGRLRNPLYT